MPRRAREEHRDLRDPGEPLVEDRHRLLRGHAAGAEHQPGEVGGEEAGAVQALALDLDSPDGCLFCLKFRGRHIDVHG